MEVDLRYYYIRQDDEVGGKVECMWSLTCRTIIFGKMTRLMLKFSVCGSSLAVVYESMSASPTVYYWNEKWLSRLINHPCVFVIYSLSKENWKTKQMSYVSVVLVKLT